MRRPQGDHNPSVRRLAPTLAAVGLLAVGAAWGLNQLAVWQLEVHASSPGRTLIRKQAVHEQAVPPWPEGPSLAVDLVVEQDATMEGVVEDHSAGAGDASDEPAPARDDAAPAKRTSTKQSSAKRSAPHKPTSTEARVFTIDTKRLKQRFKRLADVASHGRVLPNYRDGARKGLRFVDVAPSGLFARLGIESGDVILSVNGTEITTQQRALADFEKMRKLRTFDVVFERRGRARHVRYILK